MVSYPAKFVFFRFSLSRRYPLPSMAVSRAIYKNYICNNFRDFCFYVTFLAVQYFSHFCISFSVTYCITMYTIVYINFNLNREKIGLCVRIMFHCSSVLPYFLSVQVSSAGLTARLWTAWLVAVSWTLFSWDSAEIPRIRKSPKSSMPSALTVSYLRRTSTFSTFVLLCNIYNGKR